METGYQRSKLQEESFYYEHKKHDGSYPTIGVNTFRNSHTLFEVSASTAAARERAVLLRCLIFAAWLLSAPRWAMAEALAPAQAADRYGDNVTLHFRVRATGANAVGYAELYSEPSWRDPGAFFVRLPPATEVARYAGRVISVTGKVQAVQFSELRRMVIYVPDADQVTVLDPLPPFTPTAAYVPKVTRGFTILVHPNVTAHEEDLARALAELAAQIDEISAAVPPPVLAVLRKVRIWLEWQQCADAASRFHPARAWLLEHGYNPEKAGEIEICNLRHWVAWSKQNQPSSLLHELAHAYHFRVLGEQHKGILSAYQHAMAAGLYDSVPYSESDRRQAHAALSAAEYFAELTEAYFGRNDYYPFTRAELVDYDAEGYSIVEQLWTY